MSNDNSDSDNKAQNGHDENQSNRGDNQEVRLLIDNAWVGGIIGKGGANVKRVREESGAFVSIAKSDYRQVHERIMMVRGSPDHAAKALQAVAQLIIDTQKDKKESTEGTAGLKLLVHKSAVGAIIGKGGATIIETQQETDARIQISNEPLANSTEKTVTVSGTPSALYAAFSKILTQLRENPLRSGTKSIPYVPGQPVYAAPAYGLGAPGYGLGAPVLPIYPAYATARVGGAAGGASGAAARPEAPISTQKIAIPTVCAGAVIGKGGAVIRDLRAQSGTNISIADPDANSPNERVVTLTGQPHGIQHAVFLIRQLVEQYTPPSNSNY